MYSTPGVYSVSVTVDDGYGTPTPHPMISRCGYDPNGGFVTGGGWINSPAGAYLDDPTAVEATGFVAKYVKNGVSKSEAEFELEAK